MEDVVVIGAGLSGLTAAQELHQLGYRVLVVDKSRGLGGRLATRRIGATVLDHGCRYLQPFADLELSPIPALLASGILQPWQPEGFELSADGLLTAMSPQDLYVAPQGMSAVAKAMASELTIQRHWLATRLTPLSQGWQVEGTWLGESEQDKPKAFAARAVVLAIPAPQAAALLHTAAQRSAGIDDLLHQIQRVGFDAVITVMAGYGPDRSTRLASQERADGWMIAGNSHPTLRWIALDSSKRADPPESVIVLHSSAAFAADALDQANLEPTGQTLLAEAAHLGAWMLSPDWMQVHRWRYGFVRQALGAPILASPKLTNLVGCGDWCSGSGAEDAIASGRQAAAAVVTALS
ncbi:NAD(P)/FAD-dependent oxidoreductase [Nodosilinea nodulosa]|uniref:NAD(P)/FAD-dependent oxidoreductase n=1 Tax=Nodosilinea nodulosa TaxID=416001 RepID=UPI00030930C8|nr:FAD-dependent oxidoreductase [Nodosilinea nodulosa]